MELIDRLHKRATCIYIAVEKDIADDVSAHLREAAAEIARLTAERDKVRAAWLWNIQVSNHCASDGVPCHSHKCGCALEMQSLIDGNEQNGRDAK